MLSDVLTKLNVDPEFLLYVLSFGKHVVVKEIDTLQWRLNERETGRGKKALTCSICGMCEMTHVARKRCSAVAPLWHSCGVGRMVPRLGDDEGVAKS